LVCRIKHINNKTECFILCGIIGSLAGLAAVTLKVSVHFIQHIIHAVNFDILKYFYPFVGITNTVIISRYMLKKRLGHGESDILYAISRKSSYMLTEQN